MPDPVPLPRPPATIRRARSDDVDTVHSVVREAFAPYIARIGRPPKPMTEDYRTAVAAGAVWVAEVDGRLCGVLVIEHFPDHLLIDTIAVDSRLRGTGLGTALLQHAEQRARDAAVPEVRLYTHELMTENLRFYPRRGYCETGRRVEEDGRARVFFAKLV